MTIIKNLEASPSQIRIRTHRSFHEAENAWRRFEETGACYVFQTYDLLSLWHTFMGQPAGIEPCLMEVEDARAGPLLFLPFGLEKHRGLKRLVWLGDGIADYRGPIVGAGYDRFSQSTPFPTLWRRVKESLPPCDVIHFKKQPDHIGDHPNPMLEAGRRPHPRSAHARRLSGNWKDMYEQAFSSRTRRRDREKERRLERVGGQKFSLSVEPQQAPAVLDRVAEFKSRRLEAQGFRNVFAAPGYFDIWKALITDRKNGLEAYLSALTVGDEVAAAHLGLLHKGRFYSLVPTYNDNDTFSPMSPGALIFRRLLEWACDNGVEVFDFTIGDEPYKDRWCDIAMPLWDHVEPISLSGRVYAAQTSVMTKVKDLVRSVPAAANLYRDAIKRSRRLQKTTRFR